MDSSNPCRDRTVDEKVRGFLLQYAGNHPLADDDDIFELGLVNSLVALDIINFIEKTFSVTVTPEEIQVANFASVSAIGRLVGRLSDGPSP